jgi:protocatechuate 3,4-dioxygenase alpha subunit
MSGLTPFQTVGPFFSIGLKAGLDPLAPFGSPDAITIVGRLIDGAGEGIPDGLLEFWHPTLSDIGRVPTAADGTFTLSVMKPASQPGPDGMTQAPHLAVRVLGRGIQTAHVTRVYFDDETSTANDPVLQLVPESRRASLIATRTGPATYRFDVIVQGPAETVFFDA